MSRKAVIRYIKQEKKSYRKGMLRRIQREQVAHKKYGEKREEPAKIILRLRNYYCRYLLMLREQY